MFVDHDRWKREISFFVCRIFYIPTLKEENSSNTSFRQFLLFYLWFFFFSCSFSIYYWIIVMIVMRRSINLIKITGLFLWKSKKNLCSRDARFLISYLTVSIFFSKKERNLNDILYTSPSSNKQASLIIIIISPFLLLLSFYWYLHANFM